MWVCQKYVCLLILCYYNISFCTVALFQPNLLWFHMLAAVLTFDWALFFPLVMHLSLSLCFCRMAACMSSFRTASPWPTCPGMEGPVCGVRPGRSTIRTPRCSPSLSATWRTIPLGSAPPWSTTSWARQVGGRVWDWSFSWDLLVVVILRHTYVYYRKKEHFKSLKWLSCLSTLAIGAGLEQGIR